METFENGKSPDEDGFTVEFYKHFFDRVGVDLLASLNGAYEFGRLSVSQRRGIITLLPKHDAELLFLQNWQPITLLNWIKKLHQKLLQGELSQYSPNLYIRTKLAS